MPNAKLQSSRTPAIWFRSGRPAGSGHSKLGGRPSLPRDIEWPRQSKLGTPLHFLAQIDLATLPSTPLAGDRQNVVLPRNGILFFFADMVEEMLWGAEDSGGPLANTRVIYAGTGGQERAPPTDIPAILHSAGSVDGGYMTGAFEFGESQIEPFVIDTFVGAWKNPRPDETQAVELDNTIVASMSKAAGQKLKNDVPRHQMLGAGQDIQDTIAEDAFRKGLVLLLQIDSDASVDRNFFFCDAGTAQFWIKREDLINRRFDRAWATTEGH